MSCWVVSKKDAGQSLRQFLRDRVSGASLRQIKCAIDQGLVDINGRSESVSTKVLRLGDNICFHSESLAAKEEVAKGFDVDRIIFEDEYLLAYNKPPMVTSTDKGGLLSILRKHYPGLQALHRLDKDTSGVLLFAKKTVAAEGLLLQFKEREILKVYWAIVDGVPIRKSGSVSNYLGQRRTLQGKVVWGVVEPEYGGLAKTEWHVIKHGRKAALVECKPKTGRTHQIRVHLSDMGHAILGDIRYGKNFRCPYKPYRFLLHAYKLIFTHPVTGDKVHLEAPVPPDFRRAIKYIDGR